MGHYPKGFTLIELLVVLFVLSLVTGLAVFSIFKNNHNIENSSQVLRSRLRLAQMEALHEQKALGIALDEKGYKFYQKNIFNNDWVLITDDNLFKAQSFPADTQLTLTVNGKIQSLSQEQPQVILLQGNLSPFSLLFKDNENHQYEISLNNQGDIVWASQP